MNVEGREGGSAASLTESEPSTDVQVVSHIMNGIGLLVLESDTVLADGSVNHTQHPLQEPRNSDEFLRRASHPKKPRKFGATHLVLYTSQIPVSDSMQLHNSAPRLRASPTQHQPHTTGNSFNNTGQRTPLKRRGKLACQLATVVWFLEGVCTVWCCASTMNLFLPCVCSRGQDSRLSLGLCSRQRRWCKQQQVPLPVEPAAHPTSC